MYLLDTNVVSELRKVRAGKADKWVAAWAESAVTAELYLSVITILELEIGAKWKARQDAAHGRLLRTWIDAQVLPAFVDRILPIDVGVAQRCAALHVPNTRSERDALIAATALCHGLRVVTRNVSDFEGLGVEIVNPFGG